MPLRNPVFLDMATLAAHGEYNDVVVPRAAEIVEKTVSKRGGTVGVGVGAATLGGTLGKDIELQASYSLTPTDKATVSRLIDGLHQRDVIQSTTGSTPYSRGELLELEGDASITGCSIAAKLFYLALQVIRETDQSLDDLDMTALEPQFLSLAKDVYLGNAVLPIPLLMELENTGLTPRVFLNLAPDHFVDSAATDRVEGHIQVLGSISQLVAEDRYLTAEHWLLHGWEQTMRRTLMTRVDEMVADLVQAFDVDLPDDDVRAYFTGPAIVLDAIAVY